MLTQETNGLQQKRQNKQRNSKEELKHSTNSYKFYCGVEHSRALHTEISQHCGYLFEVFCDPSIPRCCVHHYWLNYQKSEGISSFA